jgi:hypothetical protein
MLTDTPRNATPPGAATANYKTTISALKGAGTRPCA